MIPSQLTNIFLFKQSHPIPPSFFFYKFIIIFSGWNKAIVHTILLFFSNFSGIHFLFYQTVGYDNCPRLQLWFWKTLKVFSCINLCIIIFSLNIFREKKKIEKAKHFASAEVINTSWSKLVYLSFIPNLHEKKESLEVSCEI